MFLRRPVFVLLLAIVAAVGWGVTRRRPETERARPAEAPADPVTVRPAVPAPALTGVPFLGINEAVSLPPAGIGASFGARAILDRRVRMTRALGARMVRANSHAWPYLNHQAFARAAERASPGREPFADADRLVQLTGAEGLDLLIVVGPWPGTRTALATPRYLPDDLPAYEAWVESLVERYDGDGIDDMPGLTRPVRAWQVDNEPDLHNAVAPRGSEDAAEGRDQALDRTAEGPAVLDALEGAAAEGTGFEPPAEYAAVLIATSRAIRRADPDATVVSAGIFGAGSERGRAYLADVLRVPGARESIDAVGLHCYFMADDLGAVQRVMRSAREVAPGLPVWITETSVPSVHDAPHVDEEWQAGMVAGIVGAFLAEGAERIFWHSLVDAPGERAGPRGFSTNSLFGASLDGDTTSFAMKPSGQVFRRLAGHLDGIDPRDVAEVLADGGRLLETEAGWLAFEGAPTLPPGAGTVEDLRDGDLTPPGERAQAPAWIARAAP
jgi:hypothetical protein